MRLLRVLLALLGTLGLTGCAREPRGSREANMTSAPPPPAPFIGPDRSEVLRIVRAHPEDRPLTISLGQYAPQAVLTHEAGLWQVRRLVSDPQRLARIEAEQRPRGSFMPEHTWGALAPGPVILEARSKAEFLRGLEGLRWQF